MRYNLRYCHVRIVSPDRKKVMVGGELGQTKAKDYAREQRQFGRYAIGTILDIISPVQHSGSTITRYSVVAGWLKVANAWKKLPHRDGKLIDGTPERYI